MRQTNLLAVGATGIALLAACTTMPEGTRVLTGDALSAELSGQRLSLAPPDGSGFADGVRLIAELRTNGAVRLTSTLEGAPIDLFDENERWLVQGQSLCVFDGPRPEARDCAVIEWIGNGQLKFNNAVTGEVGVGAYTPL